MRYYEIGQRIRHYRKACGLSQEALAEEVGISVTHMSHIETGNTKLSLPVLVNIAEALSVQRMLCFTTPHDFPRRLRRNTYRICLIHARRNSSM